MHSFNQEKLQFCKYIVIRYNAKVGNTMSIKKNIHGKNVYIFCSLFLLLQETLKFTLVGTLEEVLLSAFEGRGLRPVSKL